MYIRVSCRPRGTPAGLPIGAVSEVAGTWGADPRRSASNPRYGPTPSSSERRSSAGWDPANVIPPNHGSWRRIRISVADQQGRRSHDQRRWAHHVGHGTPVLGISGQKSGQRSQALGARGPWSTCSIRLELFFSYLPSEYYSPKGLQQRPELVSMRLGGRRAAWRGGKESWERDKVLHANTSRV